MNAHCAGEPTRISALNSLTKCSGLVAARAVSESDSGAAADTGTAVGRGAELWHETTKDADEILHVLAAENKAEFPLAKMEDVERIVRAYCADDRNQRHFVVSGSCERTVKLTLDPDPDDPTGLAIELEGHIDQLRYSMPEHARRDELGYKLWDVKNGRGSGQDMLHDYANQLCAYTVALAADYGEGEVAVGGVIRTRGYIARGKPDPSEANVHFHASWSPEHCRAVLAGVAYQIGQIRKGTFAQTPGSWCRWCPMDFPSCLTGDLRRVLKKAKK